MSQQENLPEAMDIDPVDDGPKHQDTPMLPSTADGSAPPAQTTPISINQEEEARKAIEMLRGDDVANRVSAANRLDAVASALGDERTRDVSLKNRTILASGLKAFPDQPNCIMQELLPFLADGVDDEDEVLLAMATSLGKLVKHVGGPEYAHCLLVPLELLLTVGEYRSEFN